MIKLKSAHTAGPERTRQLQGLLAQIHVVSASIPSSSFPHPHL